ncbi:hypothetical protein ACOSP7_027232 [Xanthoceras sorbifolium]
MALQIPSSPSSFTTNNKPYHLLLSKPKSKFTTTFLIKSQNTPGATNTEPAQESGPSKKPKPDSPGLGFGSSSSSPSSSSSTAASGKANVTGVSKKNKLKSKRERGSVIRRTPVEKPSLMISQEEEAKAKEMMKNESAFLLAWLGIGGVIFVQGIALSVSGFLPEEVDKFFVKYLYPTFTPTVAFFVAGTVAYGVLKYLQNEKLNEPK